jgi:hypothetical protein
VVDYFNSHVVTPKPYLVVLKQKTLEKEVANKIKEYKAKEKEEKRSR